MVDGCQAQTFVEEGSTECGGSFWAVELLLMGGADGTASLQTLLLLGMNDRPAQFARFFPRIFFRK